MVVLVAGDKFHDATLAALALERLGHGRFAILNGGFARWAAENRPLDTALPNPSKTSYLPPAQADGFSVGYLDVLARVRSGDAVILDVRPFEYFSGQKSDEARPGHIPGALNRPYTEDIEDNGKYKALKPVSALAAAYASLVPSVDSTVIVHCRTGHQASQTYFVLRHLLGNRNVYWYDGGWNEWSAHPELPVVAGE